nr:hypothetical protein [Tanacetum cinerariifolium]
MWIQEPVGYNKHALWGISHWGRKRQQFYSFAINMESARDVYSKRKIIAVTELKIVEWHNYKHLDWITVCRDDDKLYKFKEGDFKRLRIQDIEDMLLLLVQGKRTNLAVEERFAFNVSLRMFTRSIVIQRRVKDLQLGVKIYQKNLNITRPDTYRSDLKRKEAYTAYSNPRGFIYQYKDKQNMLMQIDELHKFSDGTLTDVRTALDNYLKGIRMKYLPQTIWRKSDKERAAAMIQAIDKQLKTRRIMRSLERFVGGRLYEGDFRVASTDHMIHHMMSLSFKEKDKSKDEEKMFKEEDDDVAKELYGDLNITQGLRDTDLTNAQQGGEDQLNASHESGFMQEEEDTHVTLTTIHDKTEGPLQSSSISYDFTSKLPNLDDPSSDINSLMNTSTIPPPPPPVNPSSHPTTIPQQQTPDSITTTTTYPTMTLPEIKNFMSLFYFDQRVSALETKVSEFNQTSQFAEAIPLILSIVDNYLASKLKEEVNVAVRVQSNKLKEEAKAENQEFINQVDSTMKQIIKEQVKAKVSKIMPQIKKYVTESVGAKVLGEMIKTRMKTTPLDQIEGRKEESQARMLNLSKGLKSKESKSSSSFKGTQSQHKSSEEPEFEAADIEMHQDQGNESGHIDDQPDNEKWISAISKECYKERQPPHTFDELMCTPIYFSVYVMNHLKIDNLTQEILVGPTFNLLKGTCKSIAELEYHFEECYKAVNDRLDWHDPKGREYPFDLSKPLLLIEDQGRQVVPADYFINNDLEYLKGGSSISKYATSTSRTMAAKYNNIKGREDMVPTLWSPYRRNRLMHTDELYKFYDGTLLSVRRMLHDIASNLGMDYLPIRHYSNLEMKRSRIMVKAIDKLLFERSVKVMRWYDYGYLEEIVVRRDDNMLYKFKEDDFPRLNLCDIEDMQLLLV